KEIAQPRESRIAPGTEVVTGLNARQQWPGQRVFIVAAVQMDRDGHLLEIVNTNHPQGLRLALAHCGQQQGRKNGDDGNDDEQLDQAEPASERAFLSLHTWYKHRVVQDLYIALLDKGGRPASRDGFPSPPEPVSVA